MNVGDGGCSEPKIMPLHSSLGNRARLCLKKKKTIRDRTGNRSGEAVWERKVSRKALSSGNWVLVAPLAEMEQGAS